MTRGISFQFLASDGYEKEGTVSGGDASLNAPLKHPLQKRTKAFYMTLRLRGRFVVFDRHDLANIFAHHDRHILQTFNGDGGGGIPAIRSAVVNRMFIVVCPMYTPIHTRDAFWMAKLSISRYVPWKKPR